MKMCRGKKDFRISKMPINIYTTLDLIYREWPMTSRFSTATPVGKFRIRTRVLYSNWYSSMSVWRQRDWWLDLCICMTCSYCTCNRESRVLASTGTRDKYSIMSACQHVSRCHINMDLNFEPCTVQVLAQQYDTTLRSWNEKADCAKGTIISSSMERIDWWSPSSPHYKRTTTHVIACISCSQRY